MGLSSLLSPLLILGILLGAAPRALELLTRHEYPTHERGGGVLITGDCVQLVRLLMQCCSQGFDYYCTRPYG